MLKICFRSTHVAEQHIFSMFPSILIFYFIYIEGRFWLFVAKWANLRFGIRFKICFRSTHVAEQHTFSMSPSIFALALRGPKIMPFLGLGSGSNCFGVYSYSPNTFIFFVSFNSDI